MISLVVDDLSLSYRLGNRFTLAPQDRRLNRAAPIENIGRTTTVHALRNVTFSLSAGDRLALVGPNGSGKTTLLKVLYGIFDPSGGRVCVDGRVDALFNISLGFRREATGRRNIVLRGLINGWSESTIRERIDDIIEFSELGDFIDLPFKAYSQGMAARLAFSIATSFEPEILLMDEWIGAGDPNFQEKARERMESLTKKAGIIVLASHNYSMLKRTCNKVLQLEYGRVTYFGDAKSFFNSAPTSGR